MTQDEHDQLAAIFGAVARMENPVKDAANRIGQVEIDVQALSQKVDQLAAGGGAIDYATLAKAVADELHGRLAQ